jgi:ribosomal protein S18 acetylase RimI-like enzyme
MAILVSMGERSYRSFFEVAVKSYAEDNVASGRWSAQDALALAQVETERLLPQGHATPDHFLFEIRESLGGQLLGYLWAAALNRGIKKVAFIYQLQVLPQFRRQGHGRAALQEFAVIAKGLGFESVALNVFGSNAGAQALYRSLGFVTTSISMQKNLLQDGA